MIVNLLTEHDFEFLSSKRGYRGSCESTHVKMPHCRESHALAQLILYSVTQMLCTLGPWTTSILRFKILNQVDSPIILFRLSKDNYM